MPASQLVAVGKLHRVHLAAERDLTLAFFGFGRQLPIKEQLAGAEFLFRGEDITPASHESAVGYPPTLVRRMSGRCLKVPAGQRETIE